MTHSRQHAQRVRARCRIEDPGQRGHRRSSPDHSQPRPGSARNGQPTAITTPRPPPHQPRTEPWPGPVQLFRSGGTPGPGQRCGTEQDPGARRRTSASRKRARPRPGRSPDRQPATARSRTVQQGWTERRRHPRTAAARRGNCTTEGDGTGERHQGRGQGSKERPDGGWAASGRRTAHSRNNPAARTARSRGRLGGGNGDGAGGNTYANDPPGLANGDRPHDGAPDAAVHTNARRHRGGEPRRGRRPRQRAVATARSDVETSGSGHRHGDHQEVLRPVDARRYGW